MAASAPKSSTPLHRALARIDGVADPAVRIRAIQRALRLDAAEAARAPKTRRSALRGVLLTSLGQELTSRGGRRNRERAVAVLEEALAALPARAHPERARAQIALAVALHEEPGDGAGNIERALSLYARALRRLDRNIHREEWAQAQLNLGSCRADRSKGVREDNLERAIAAYDAALGVYTRSRTPDDWARTQMNRALVLSERQRDRARAQRAAISGMEAALTVRTRRRAPREWATCQSNLGALYFECIDGDRGENLERAIAAFRNALKVRTRSLSFPDWATTMGNLAMALSDRVRGDHAENLERARWALRDVLNACSRKAHPILWAKTQVKIAMILFDRPRGARRRNLERAIEAGRAALGVFDPQTMPAEWAHAQTVTANAYGDRIEGDRSANVETGIAMLQGIVDNISRRALPTEWATAHLNLGASYAERIAGSRADNIDRAIRHYAQAMSVFTEAAARLDWAAAQANLSVAFFLRPRGDRAANLERAIEAGQAALRVFTAKGHPLDWGMAHANLANAWRERIVGARAENHERALKSARAALGVLDRESAPIEWALAHAVHASVLLHRPGGAPRSNFERAIASIRRAIEIYEEHGMALDWAQAQGTLSSLYLNRIAGERADNIEHALIACRQALGVLRPDNGPMDWAAAQTETAIAFFERSRGERADNVERALEAIKAALAVYDRRESPFEWARAQGNLASAYVSREKGSQRENALEAVAAARRSLTVFSRRSAPFEWAGVTLNMAIALQEVDAGRGGGLDASIRALEDALTVLDPKDHPLDWGMAKTNLGNALRRRAAGSRGDDLRRAVASYREALRVFTFARFPEQHLRTSRLLGAACSAAGRWRAADRAFSAARAAADALMGRGLHEAERARILREVSQLGPQGALARLRCGDRLGALQALESGRSVELALSMRLDALDLPSETRRRLRELRRKARIVEEALEAPEPEDRQAMLARLAALHAELGKLAAQALGDDDGAAGLERRLANLLAHGACLVAPILAEAGSAALVARLRDGALALDAVDIAVRVSTIYGNGDDREPEAEAAMGPSIRLISPRTAANAMQRAWAVFGQAVIDAGVEKESHVVFLPPGDMGALTPALAVCDGQALLDDYTVSLAPSIALAELAQRRAMRRRAPSLGAVVDPTLDLGGAIVEHAFASSLFAARRRAAAVGVAATRDEALKVCRNRSYWLIATHGRFDRTNARESWLALADGERLTMRDMLFWRRPRDLRLVVLSACESGLHEERARPEEFQGFASMFLQTGAAGVVVAAWPVDDAASAFLIGRFFQLHVGQATAPAAALRRAQLWLRQATVQDLKRMLSEAFLSAGENASAMRKLERRLAKRAPGETPFSQPEHWAGFAFVGA